MRLAVKLRDTAQFVLLACGLYGLVGFVYTAWLKVNYPYMTNLGEPALAQAVRSLFNGVIPYHDLKFPPYSLVPYGPVYLGLAAATRTFCTAPFFGGRLLTTLSTLGTALMVYLVLRRLSAGRIPALVASLLFVSNPYVDRWGCQVNVDMMGVFFAAVTVYFLLRLDQGGFKCRSFFILAILAAVAAFFTKSSMLAAPVAFFIYLILKRRLKTAFIFSVVLGAMVGTIYLWINIRTDGNYFFHTTYEISKRNFYMRFVYDNWIAAAMMAPTLLGATFFVLGRTAWKIKQEISFFALYALFAILLTVSMGKQGSDTNYLLEWCFVSTVSLGIILEYALVKTDAGARLAKARPWIGFVICVLVVWQCVVWLWPGRDLGAVKATYEKQTQFYDNISVAVQKTGGKILSEDMGILVANGKEIFYEPFPMGQMTYSGVWDPAPIIRELDQRGFSLAILYFYAPALVQNRTFPPQILEMFKARYVFIGRAELPGQTGPTRTALYLYRPRTDNEMKLTGNY